jgi:Uma2 family endonuclease
LTVSIATPPPAKTMTVEEFLALPDDGVSRDLIRGQLRERGMTRRNRFHSATESRIVFLLGLWLQRQPAPQGEIVSGQAGFRLGGTPESAVGIDVAYVSPELLASCGPKHAVFHGPPILAVEILSPSDTREDVVEKVELYLEFGVVVWEVDTEFRTVRVHRPGRPPETFNEQQELRGDPDLAGFCVPVAKFFEP